MYLWIVFIAAVLAATLFVGIGMRLCWDFLHVIISFPLYVVAAFVLLVCIVQTVYVPKEISLFERQKQYIETHVVKDDVENAALTNTKIELNLWLYNVQYKNANWGGWSFYPDEVQSLQPIQ